MVKLKKGQLWESKFDSQNRALVVERDNKLYVKYLFGSERERPVDVVMDLDLYFTLAKDSPVK